MIRQQKIWLTFLMICLRVFSGTHDDDYKITDPHFLKYIKKNFPQIVDGDGDGIHPYMAATIYGTLDISNCNLYNVNGLQYFTNVYKIDLHNNNLTTLPDLGGITNLQSLNVSFNKLNSLPSLNSNVNLVELMVQNNKLLLIPDLSKNVLLTQLIINNNQISQLPDFSNLKALLIFVADNNSISTLPNLSKCRSLHTLCISSNKLSETPIIDSLVNLKTLNLAFNKLTKFPNFTYNTVIELVYLNDNQFGTIGNLPILKNLVKMKLYNNMLTFSSIIKILPYSNHKNIFEIAPQANIYAFQSIEKKVTDTVDIYTGIDDDVPSVYYKWQKNYSYYYTCKYDHLSISNLSFSDSGTYFCEIKHDSFPELSFRSDNYTLRIKNCFDVSTLAYSISTVDCEHSGKLQINNNDNNTKVKYILARDAYSYSDTSQIGQFNGLLDGSYTLKVLTDRGCTVNVPKEINVPKEDCGYPLITPNDDNDHDTYFFEQTGTVIIYDKHGDLIKTLNIPGAWDASSKNNKVRAGVYIADINKGEQIIKISVVY